MFRLRDRLLLILVGLAVGPLLVVVGVLSRYTYDTLQGEAMASQSATAELVDTKIQTFIQSREDELQVLSGDIYGLDNLDLESKTILMSLLLARLFERFFRGKVGLASGAPGTGLGLALAKEIIDLHQGRIRATNAPQPPAGATFVIELPLGG
jgi:light-regulated signal transduction histidine kinase (bacteriophytochrome)